MPLNPQREGRNGIPLGNGTWRVSTFTFPLSPASMMECNKRYYDGDLGQILSMQKMDILGELVPNSAYYETEEGSKR